MSQPATTFRFPPEVREELERIKDATGTTTLQGTVEQIILAHFKQQKQYREVLSRAIKAENEAEMYKSRLRGIKGAFNVILNYPIDGETTD